MASIDFSNATLEPVITVSVDSYITLNPTWNITKIYDASGNEIGVFSSKQLLTDETNYFTVLFVGSMSASGTEMYLGANSGTQKYWKISNISFASGDTFTLQIKGQFDLS